MMEKYNLNYPPTYSYWEIREYLSGMDLLVIGGGIVGLTSAIFFKRENPKAKVAVVERGIFPSGASTKNAGFACFGSLSELLDDLRSHSVEEVFELVGKRLEGLKQLRKLLGDDQLNYKPCGGFELFTQNDPGIFEQCATFLPEANKILHENEGLANTYSIVSEKIDDFGFRMTDNLIMNSHEGSIDTGKMMRGLISKAESEEIQILTGCTVSDWNETANGVLVKINDFEMEVGRLHIATNGFANRLLPKEAVLPARAQVLITKPIPNLKIDGTFHLDAGFYYFRNVDNRVLLGGGRNLDISGETDTELAVTKKIQSKLDELLQEVILPDTHYSIAHRWAGVMGVGSAKNPIVKHVSSRVTCSVRLGGMGVALGTSVGMESTRLIEQAV